MFKTIIGTIALKKIKQKHTNYVFTKLAVNLTVRIIIKEKPIES